MSTADTAAAEARGPDRPAEAGTLVLVAQTRLAGLRPGERSLPAATVLTVCDHGPEIDRSQLRFNAARRDPWFFRAAECGPCATDARERARFLDALLHVFALVHLPAALGKLALSRNFDRVRLVSTALPSPDGGETLAMATLTSPNGKAALQALRCQCIAGNAAAMLPQGGHRLAPWLER